MKLAPFFTAFILLLLASAEALGCPTCMPRGAEGETASAADASIIFLGGLVIMIMAGFLGMFGYFSYRSRNPVYDEEWLASIPADER